MNGGSLLMYGNQYFHADSLNASQMNYQLPFLLFCIITVSSCQYHKENTSPKQLENKNIIQYTLPCSSPPPFDVTAHLTQYEILKKEIKKERNRLSKQTYPSTIAKRQVLQQHFLTALVDSIFPYWYGTTWNFNGHTTTPRKGAIACGYFVTTTLRDVGIPLKRIYLSQQPSSVMINQLCHRSSIKRYATLKQLQHYLTSNSHQIFILGLDYHVGFVVKQDKQLYFIHANYSGDKVVEKELLHKSVPILSSKSFMIGELGIRN